MRQKSGRRLNEIVKIAGKVREFMDGVDRETYLASPVLQDATSMNLIHIAEQLIDLRDHDADVFGQITDG